MKFLDTKGKEHSKAIDIAKYKLKDISKSIGQHKLGEKLQQLYPQYNIFEEFPCVGEDLVLDFFIPFLKIAFEWNGEQHVKYNKHFHKNRSGFAASIIRDNKKALWCELNEIRLIIVDKTNINKIGEIINGTDNARSKGVDRKVRTNNNRNKRTNSRKNN